MEHFWSLLADLNTSHSWTHPASHSWTQLGLLTMLQLKYNQPFSGIIIHILLWVHIMYVYPLHVHVHVQLVSLLGCETWKATLLITVNAKYNFCRSAWLHNTVQGSWWPVGRQYSTIWPEEVHLQMHWLLRNAWKDLSSLKLIILLFGSCTVDFIVHDEVYIIINYRRVHTM